jgi:large subunit ribosomal protein L31
MKKGIHPKYFDQATVSCACGNIFKVGSSRPQITVEICYKCHPLFTGEERFVDTQGQVEKFMEKRKIALKYSSQKAISKEKRAKNQAPQKTLKDLLSSA